MTYISAGALVVTCVINFLLALGHILNYREPRVQKQLIRMLWMPSVFAIFSFFGVWKYHLTNYFTPIAELYEAFALVGVFFLTVAYLVPSSDWPTQVAFFSAPENGGYGLFATRNIVVMQIIPVHIITLIAIEVVTGTSCDEGKTYKHAYTAYSIINGFSATMALIAILRMLIRNKTALKAADSKVVGKLATFKIIVWLQFLQRIVFSILSTANALTPTRTLSYNDLNLGLNSFVTTLEVMIISIFMIYYYWPRQYKHHPVDYEHTQASGSDSSPEGRKEGAPPSYAGPKPKLGFRRAILDALNMSDVIQGMLHAIQLVIEKRSGGRSGNLPR